ncbi:MAG: sulfatase-like hydrolase/transferase, partial [Verrucomicrobia bacterium]|nr:sulfatase-like hydrolase/transferase [Verrucomicrobiota bacterium]
MREVLIFRTAAATVALSLSVWVACGRGPSSDAIAVHLVDRFDPQSIKGTASLAAMKPSALWNFSAAENAGGGNPRAHMLGWKAGPGVTGLQVVDGKLTGRSTTDSALIYATVPDTIDAADGFHSIELRIRVDRGEAIKANPGGETLDLKTLDPKGWSLAGPLAPGEHFNTAIVKDSNVRTMGAFHTVAIHPVDVEGARFEIESIRLISRKEHRDKIPSGVGWQGLSGVFHETIVSRSPESFTIDADLPPNARLNLSIGTVQPSPVSFKIEAVSSDGPLPLFQRTLTTPHRWEDAPVDLSSFSGTARLRFSLVAEQASTLGFWGSPKIVSVGAKPRAERAAGEAFGGVEPPQGVILFVADTLRRDHLDFHGYARDTTPNLSAMASEGTAFLDAISQAPWTKVSIPSILTSLYPTSHRVFDIPDRISATATTLAEVYRAAGYATVSFPSNNFAGTMTNLHQGFEEMHEAAAFDRDDFGSKTARTVVDHALRWLDGHSDVPFFMYVHVLDP